MVESKPTNQHKQKYLNTGEVAERLGSSKGTVRDLCRRGLLSGANKERKGGPWRIPEKAVEEWIKNNKPAISTDDFSVNKQVIESKGSFQVSETPGPPIWWQRFRYSPWIFYPTVVFGILIAVIGVLSGLISLGADFGGFKNQVHQWGIVRQFPPAADNETLIVIATFHRTEGVTDTDAHNEIRRAIEVAALELGIHDLRVEVEPTQLGSEAQVAAKEIGEKYKASIVIWGSDTGVRITVNFLNLKEPTLPAAKVRINEIERTQLANPKGYASFVTQDLPAQLTFLSLFAIGQSYAIKAEYKEAVRVTERSIAFLPHENGNLHGVSEAYFFLGWLYGVTEEDLDQILYAYSKAIEINPKNVIAYYNRGITHDDLGEYSKAIVDYTRAIELDPYFGPAYMNRAVIYYNLENYDQAIIDINKSIELNPNDADAYNNLGNTQSALGDYRQAIVDLTKAINLNPNYSQFYSNRGGVYYALQQYDNAIIDFDKAIELKPDYSEAYYNRGKVYQDLGEYVNAIADYTEALKFESKDSASYNNRGNVYIEMGQYELALTDFNEAIDLGNVSAYTNRGTALFHLERYEQAIADFNKAIELNPLDANALNNRGKVYTSLEQYEQAITDFNRAIELDPDLYEVYYNRGLAFHSYGKYNQAIGDFNKIIELEPDYASAYGGRGLVYFDLNDKEKAISDFEVYLKLEPNSPVREEVILMMKLLGSEFVQ